MIKIFQILLVAAYKKVDRSFSFVENSIDENLEFEIEKTYISDELEPFDALSDRFFRCIETFIKFFTTYGRYESVTSALTYRDLMNIMAKQELITSVEL